MTNIVTDELHKALVDAEAALAERAKFEALARTIVVDRTAAEARATAARAVADAAEAEALLGSAQANQQVKTARAQAQEADGVTARLDAAERILPAKMTEADAQLIEAAAAVEAAAVPVRAAALDAFINELKEVTDALGAVVLKGYALNAAGVSVGRYLNELVIPHPHRGHGALLQQGILNTGSEPVDLRTTWNGSDQAVALHAELEPLHRAQLRLRPHVARIEQDKERARIAQNQASYARSFTADHDVRTPRPPETPAPKNEHPFVPSVHRQLGSPAPQEGNWLHATLIPTQR